MKHGLPQISQEPDLRFIFASGFVGILGHIVID